MAATSRPIKCKSCDRALATVSPQGLIPAEAAEIQGCDTCQQFSALYDAMQAADEEYAPLSQKGDKHRGKQFAVAKVNKTHMDFDNWLIGVEAPVKKIADQQDGGEEEGQEAEEILKVRVQQQQAIKRARSHSPTTQQSGKDDAQSEALENQTTQEQQALSIPLRPSPKRSRSATSLPERKRLKFSDSVEFRDDYRSYLTLGRSSEEYVPGRYAPPESGYLDTSGADQTFPKFTGLKKVRGTWLEVKEKDDESVSKAATMAAELRGLGVSDDATTQEHRTDPESGETLESDAERDSRSARLARRTRRSSSVDTAQNKDDPASQTIAIARRGRRKSLNITLGEARELSSDAAANLPSIEAERKDDHPIGTAVNATQDLGASEKISDGGIGEDQTPAIEMTGDDKAEKLGEEQGKADAVQSSLEDDSDKNDISSSA